MHINKSFLFGGSLDHNAILSYFLLVFSNMSVFSPDAEYSITNVHCSTNTIVIIGH